MCTRKHMQPMLTLESKLYGVELDRHDGGARGRWRVGFGNRGCCGTAATLYGACDRGVLWAKSTCSIRGGRL
jgi:hypothetical protein